MTGEGYDCSLIAFGREGEPSVYVNQYSNVQMPFASDYHFLVKRIVLGVLCTGEPR